MSNPRNRTLITVVLLFLSFLYLHVQAELPSPPAPVAIRTVQVAAFSATAPTTNDLQKKEALKADLAAKGYGPVWEQVLDKGEIGTWSCLFVGKLHNLPDATLLKHDLRKDGFSDAFEKAIPNTEKVNFDEEVENPNFPFLIKKVSDNPDSFTETERLLIDGVSRMNAADVAEAKALAPQLAEGNALRRALEMKLTNPRMAEHIQKINFPVQRSEKPEKFDMVEGEMLPKLLPIASGEAPMPKAYQIEAAFKVADLYHEYIQDKMHSYAIYREILRTFGEDPAVEARARVEIAALLMELARSEKAYFNEVQRECAIIHYRLPYEYVNARAVAELMYWESKYFVKDYESAARELEAFAERYPTCIREITGANFYAAAANDSLGNYDKALQLWSRNFDLEIPQEELFFWGGAPISMKAASRKQIYWMAKKRMGYSEEQLRQFTPQDEDKIQFTPTPFGHERFSRKSDAMGGKQ